MTSHQNIVSLKQLFQEIANIRRIVRLHLFYFLYQSLLFSIDFQNKNNVCVQKINEEKCYIDTLENCVR